MSIPVILDVDTGVDDSIAILLALRLPQLNVKAITTVSGNVHVDEVTESTKTVLGLTDYTGIRLGRGASVSLRRTRFHAPEVHGSDGLGNIRKKYERNKAKIRTERAVPLIRETIKKSDKPVTIIATGPLTNIARAIQKDKRIMRRVKHIISMGGSFGHRGNTGPLAEFNYFVDPDAVDVVARSGIPFTVIPLNVTETVPLQRKTVMTWEKKYKSLIVRFVADVTKYYMNYHNKVESFNGGFMHDPLTVAIAADPSIITKKIKRPFLIETKGKYTSGTTLNRDAIGSEQKAPNISIVTGVDRQRFWRLFRATLFEISDQ
jgi:inosine-uridine nucleoside N-ribohydrolase